MIFQLLLFINLKCLNYNSCSFRVVSLDVRCSLDSIERRRKRWRRRKVSTVGSKVGGGQTNSGDNQDAQIVAKLFGTGPLGSQVS